MIEPKRESSYTYQHDGKIVKREIKGFYQNKITGKKVKVMKVSGNDVITLEADTILLSTIGVRQFLKEYRRV